MRVLFVDDDPLVLEVMKRVLSLDSSVKVALAGSGSEAIAAMEALAPDVVVSDVRMPAMDGIQLLTTIQQRWPKTIRIVLTSEISRDAAVALLPVAHQFLIKPCSSEELLEIIRRSRRLLSKHREQSVLELIGGISALPSLPETYSELAGELGQPSAHPNRIAQVIERNPPIALKVMQVANSAFFSRRTGARDVAEAILHLGTQTVQHVVLHLAAYQMADKLSPAVRLYLRKVQARSLRVAECASQLVTVPALRGQALLAGLLCDIGQIILGTHRHDEWKEVIREFERTGQPLEHLEMQHMGLSHAELGALLMEIWGLPHVIVASAAWHHDTRMLDHGTMDISSAVCLANLLVDSTPVEERVLERLGVLDLVLRFHRGPTGKQ